MKHNFGEQKTERKNGKAVEVWQTPRYLEAKNKVISLLDSAEYKDILSDADFWILKNFNKEETICSYTTLIINHNACLKLNDHLPKEDRFDPAKCRLLNDPYNNGLLMEYRDNDLLEYGEVNRGNCRNEYPYAMVLKRLFDRVVLKKTKIAYSGVMSDSESEAFSYTPPVKEKKKEEAPQVSGCINSTQWANLRKLYDLKEIQAMYTELNIQKGNEIPVTYYEQKVKERTQQNENHEQAQSA